MQRLTIPGTPGVPQGRAFSLSHLLLPIFTFTHRLCPARQIENICGSRSVSPKGTCEFILLNYHPGAPKAHRTLPGFALQSSVPEGTQEGQPAAGLVPGQHGAGCHAAFPQNRHAGVREITNSGWLEEKSLRPSTGWRNDGAVVGEGAWEPEGSRSVHQKRALSL